MDMIDKTDIDEEVELGSSSSPTVRDINNNDGEILELSTNKPITSDKLNILTTTDELYPEDVKVNPDNPTISTKLSKTILLALFGELFIIILIVICINILYFSTYQTNTNTKNHMKVGLWISANTTDEMVEKSLLYVVDNQEKFGLNYSFVVQRYNPLNENMFHKIREKIDNGEYWSGFYVHPDASSRVMSSILQPGSPIITCDYIFDQIRSGASFQYSLSTLGSTLTNYMNSILKSQLLPELYSSSWTSYVNGIIAAKPINTISTNIHPVTKYGMFSVIGDGTMQLFLNGMYHGLGIISVHTVLRGRGIDKGALVGLMGWHRAFGSAFLAIWPVVVPLILNPDDDDISNNIPRIFQWWAFVWLELAVFSGMNYHIAKIFGGPMGLLIGVSTLMLMVASGTASLPFDAMPRFYQIGYGFPFWSSIQGLRSLLYGSEKYLLSLCIGILFIWWGVMFLNITLTRYYLNPYFGLHLFEEPEEKMVAERERVKARTLTLTHEPNENEKIEVQKGIEMQDVENHVDQTELEHDTPMLSRNRVSSEGISPESNIPEDINQITYLSDINTIPLSDPSVRPYVSEFYRKAIIFEIVLSIMMIVLLFLSYGNLWNPSTYHYRIKLAMLNLDTTTSPLSTLFTETFTGVYNTVATSSQFDLCRSFG